MTASMLWVFLILLFLSVPVAPAMLGGVAAALWFEGRPLAVITQRLYTPTQSFPMLAIPFFILAGNLMMSGKFGVYLVNVARLLVGRFKGGWARCRCWVRSCSAACRARRWRMPPPWATRSSRCRRRKGTAIFLVAAADRCPHSMTRPTPSLKIGGRSCRSPFAGGSCSAAEPWPSLLCIVIDLPP
jgi:hypothetical protein